MTLFIRIQNIFLSILLFTALLSPHSTTQAALLDKVVAVVNDDIITMTELDFEAEQYVSKVKSSVPADELAEALQHMRSEVLDRLIEDKLIQQKAKSRKVSITADEFNAAYQNLLDSNGMTREQFVAQLEKNGLTADFHKKMFRNQMLQSKLISYEIRSKIVITEDMMQDYYDNEYIEAVADGGYYLLQMGFTWDDGNKSEALEQAERVRDLAASGKDFKELARKFSDLPSAPDGGDIGVFQADELPEVMREAIINLPENDISEIIETPSGFQFFKVLSSEKGGVISKVPYETVKEEIRETLYNQKFKDDYNQWINDLKTQAYIEKN